MRRPSPAAPTTLARLALAALAACLFFQGTAWAKYVPPPAPTGHTVTTVGWLSPADIRKIDEECEIAKSQTGYVIDVLVAASDEPIDEVSKETFQAWKPGDPKKDNGILLVVQPNFPRGERKVHLQVGKGVEAVLTEAKAKDILRGKMGPLLNASDEVRTAVAVGVLEIAKTLGANLPEEGDVGDAGADASTPSKGSAASTPTGAASDAGQARRGQGAESLGNTVLFALGGFLVLILAYVGFMWLKGRKKG